ncbi:hypothetical protein BT69DRAFT_1304849 [Atractiella rhizophila]|nr:hypothetical protein BT69DRAFT_1304849 [Atractiella rhizophila]
MDMDTSQTQNQKYTFPADTLLSFSPFEENYRMISSGLLANHDDTLDRWNAVNEQVSKERKSEFLIPLVMLRISYVCEACGPFYAMQDGAFLERWNLNDVEYGAEYDSWRAALVWHLACLLTAVKEQERQNEDFEDWLTEIFLDSQLRGLALVD